MAEEMGTVRKVQSSFYRFVSTYQDYMNARRNYGNGALYSMVEMHILAIVCAKPGITVGQVAQAWGCTKGAASQNITKLEKKGLLMRTKLLGNAKEVHVFPTKEGEQAAALHNVFDKRNESRVEKSLLECCTMEELMAFNKVLGVYADIIEADIKAKR